MREMCGAVPVWFAVLLLDYRCCMLLLLQWWWLEIILQVRPPSGKASGSGATLQHDVPTLLVFTVIQLANGWPSHWRVWCWPNRVVDSMWLNSTSIFDIFGQQQCWLRNPHMLMYRCIDQHVSFAWFSFAYYYLTFPVVSGADKTKEPTNTCPPYWYEVVVTSLCQVSMFQWGPAQCFRRGGWQGSQRGSKEEGEFPGGITSNCNQSSRRGMCTPLMVLDDFTWWKVKKDQKTIARW